MFALHTWKTLDELQEEGRRLVVNLKIRFSQLRKWESVMEIS
jgi:hypothetical protein